MALKSKVWLFLQHFFLAMVGIAIIVGALFSIVFGATYLVEITGYIEYKDVFVYSFAGIAMAFMIAVGSFAEVLQMRADREEKEQFLQDEEPTDDYFDEEFNRYLKTSDLVKKEEIK